MSQRFLPKSGRRAQENEKGNKDITGGIAEVHPQIPLGDGTDDVPIHVFDHDAGASVVFPFRVSR